MNYELDLLLLDVMMSLAGKLIGMGRLISRRIWGFWLIASGKRKVWIIFLDGVIMIISCFKLIVVCVRAEVRNRRSIDQSYHCMIRLCLVVGE